MAPFKKNEIVAGNKPSFRPGHKTTYIIRRYLTNSTSE